MPLKAAVVGGCAGGAGKAKPAARLPSTPRPTGGCIEHRLRAACGPLLPPCGSQAGTHPAPNTSTAQGNRLGQGAASGARGWAAGEAAGLWLSGRGPQGPGHPHCGLCHALPIPGGPRAAPHEGIIRAQTWPPTHTDHPHAVQGRPRWPGRAARSRGQRQGPGHGRRPRPPHSDPGPPGLPPSATQGAARRHADGLRGGRGRSQPVLPPPGDQESLHGSRAHALRTCRCEWAAVSSVK